MYFNFLSFSLEGSIKTHLLLLLLHFSKQKFGVYVAFLQKVLQPLETHFLSVFLPGLSRLRTTHMLRLNKNSPHIVTPLQLNFNKAKPDKLGSISLTKTQLLIRCAMT